MTLLSAEPDHPASVTDRPVAARRSEELVYVFFVLWTMAGLGLDGWAHRHQPELESFFTPWHAVFYAGFIGGSAWLARMVLSRRPGVSSLRAAIPRGYELAVVGLIAFGLGGIGDGFWHTVLGVETGIDALLSPTHLLMLMGMLAGATAPIRSAWRDPSNQTRVGGLGPFLPVTLSVGVSTTGVAFFFLYANGFNNWPLASPYFPGRSDVLVSSGIFATLATTVILLGPVMLLLHRWKPPFGAFTVMFGMVGVLMAGLDAYEYWWQILPPLVGGLVADGVMGWTRLDGGPGPIGDTELRRRAWVAGALVPPTMWSASTATVHVAWSVAWPPELWAGQIVMATLAGFGLALISHPPSRPVRSAAET